MNRVCILGAGLAGSEAAWFLANRGIDVVLFEGKKHHPNPAQKSPFAAELVCTNSLKSLLEHSAHGILKQEMQAFGSLILKTALQNRAPAGDALAVDREKFSQEVETKLRSHRRIRFIEEHHSDPLEAQKQTEAQAVLVATGPLTCDALAGWLSDHLYSGTAEGLYFYDAIAPVVDADSLDYEKMYFKDRYQDSEGEADYLNAPMNKEQYIHFIHELVGSEKVKPKNFEEEKFFEACLPIDLMAERGVDTPRFGPMKPVGLRKDPQNIPYAVVQLRRENLLGTAFNLVGFQTRLTYKEQIRVFRLIPGLENANFIHLGSVHRNTFLNAPVILNSDLSSKKYPQLYFAGQIIGVEGYTESASMGLVAGWQILRSLKGLPPAQIPHTLAMGALIHYTQTMIRPAPSSIHFGLFPPLEDGPPLRGRGKKKEKKSLVALRAKKELEQFINVYPEISSLEPREEKVLVERDNIL